VWTIHSGFAQRTYNMRNSFILGSMLTAAIGNAAASAEVIYNSIPSTLAASYPSQPFQAQQTVEFGDRVALGGSARQLTSATMTMVNWARYEDYNVGGVYYDAGQYAGNGFTHSFTLNFYESGTGYTHGATIASVTANKFIEYRPTGWSANGFAQNITFDLTGLGITLPESIVWGLAFSTQSYGPNATGVNGPYNSLNMGCNTAADGGVTVGATDLDTVFWNTSTAAWYTDGGTNGSGIFRMDTGWTGYNPMASFSAVPAPGALALLGIAGFAGSRRRRA
jgi:MYXO-CTERM domain-containing protein